MKNLSKEQFKSRQKTLLAALLLSMWAPLATGIAVIMSTSTTQLADFIRRTVELIALFVSWFVFRYIAGNEEIAPEKQAMLEKTAGLFVSAALFCSAVAMFIVALSRLRSFEPGGNVYPGLAIACLGLITNAWFWRRYSRLNDEQYSSIIDTQRHLYRAKAFADSCVLIALAAVAINPTHALTRYLDLFGSIVIAIYLLWSSFQTARQTIKQNQIAKLLAVNNIDEIKTFSGL